MVTVWQLLSAEFERDQARSKYLAADKRLDDLRKRAAKQVTKAARP